MTGSQIRDYQSTGGNQPRPAEIIAGASHQGTVHEAVYSDKGIGNISGFISHC